MSVMIDLTGKQFGKLLVLKQDGYIGKELAWLCRCECGNEVRKRGSSLRYGKATSCQSPQCGGHGAKDWTNQRVGRLLVLEPVGRNNSRSILWRCQCDCGNEAIISNTSLSSGKTFSCGCWNREAASLRTSKDIAPGTVFSELTVLKKLDKKDSGGCYCYLCQCSCGMQVKVSSSALRSGKTTSCGHIRSKGEERIKKFLLANKVPFLAEWTSNEIRLSSGYCCRFDFAIFNSLEKDKKPVFCLEYQGEQHFHYTNKGWNTEEHFLKTLQRDQEKKTLCELQNIPLEYIIYTDYKNIESLLTLLLQKYKISILKEK